MEHGTDGEYRPGIYLHQAASPRSGPDATHTGRMLLPVPKSAFAAKANAKAEPKSQAPKTTTLRMRMQAVPKACLPAATDAKAAAEWQTAKTMLGTRTKSQATDRAESMPQATTTDVFGVQPEARMGMKEFKNLAKGSVGFLGISNQPPKAKAKALVMPRTERNDKLTASVKARGAVSLRPKARTETRSSSTDPAPTKNRMVATDIVPQLYSKGESKFVKRYRKKKYTNQQPHRDWQRYSSNS